MEIGLSAAVVVLLEGGTTIQFHKEGSPDNQNKRSRCVPGVLIAIVTKGWGLKCSGRSSTAVPVMVGVLTGLLWLLLQPAVEVRRQRCAGEVRSALSYE